MNEAQIRRAYLSMIGVGLASREMFAALVRVALEVPQAEAEALVAEVFRRQGAAARDRGELTFADIQHNPNPPVVWTVQR